MRHVGTRTCGHEGTKAQRREREKAAYSPTKFCSGFTLIELLVVLGIVLVLAGIFVPLLSASREEANRAQCANNLMQIWEAMSAYANSNGKNLPRVIYDAKNRSNGYTAFTGPDSNPFAPHSEVAPNDVTASLWLLVSRGYLKNANCFVCPSSGGFPDSMADAQGQPVSRMSRGNFRSKWNLSYGYATPFGDAPGYELNTDKLPPDFALMADQGPPAGKMPPVDAPPLEMARGNSPNHNRAGQNVLYAAGYVKFQTTPYCGNRNDNIYTVLWPTPLEKGHSPTPEGVGYRGRDLGPAYYADSYLVP